jgi:quercetin dioxygenase-like cupin family protein
LAGDTIRHWSIAEVRFEKGSRSNWHYHSGKQVLVITEGIGYLKEKDKALKILHKGDVVTIQPGVVHWHGASAENEFTQIVINPNIENGVVNWLQKVTDDEYRSGK